MSADEYALQAWVEAEIRIAEAAGQDPAVSPRALIHSAYYAMFYAARAVLLRQGSAPKTHASVVGQFGLLAKARGLEWKNAGRDLREVEDRRIRADYRLGLTITAEDARDALTKAQAFLDLCAREFGFRAPGHDAGV